MNRSFRRLRWCGAAALLFAVPAAAEVRAAPTVIIGAGEVVHDDVYAAASTVRVEGVIDGDLVATAGTVEVPGHVKGDLLTAAGTISVSGRVDGSVRALGGQLELRGPVGQDVLAAVGRLTEEATGPVGRNVMASAGEVQLRAPVGGDLRLSAGNVVLAAPIGGDANLTLQSLKLEDGAAIAGALKYRSPQAATIAPGAQVGSLEHLEMEGRGPASLALGFVFTWVRAFFAFSVLGLLLALVSPRFARAAPEALRDAPWRSLGWGALVLLAAPFVAFMLFMAGLLLGGWWLGLIAGGLVLTAMALSFPVVGYQVGRFVMAKATATGARRFGALVLGVAAVTLAVRIPILGALVALAVILFGLGSMALAGVQLRKGPPAAI